VVDMEAIGPNSIYVDCDVIDADGGTRCASITGGAVALYQALRTLKDEGMIETIPMAEMVAAVSVGIKDGEVFLDLDYALDSTVDVDMNVVMTESGKLVEVQGTAEEQSFTRVQMDQMLDLAEKGIKEIIVAPAYLCCLSSSNPKNRISFQLYFNQSSWSCFGAGGGVRTLIELVT
ncbi:MAG: ribonuclease PH, partial [Candidatus Odinarchaeia archaeon]